MRYRLKDHELQRKLDEISDGSFSSRLADVSGAIPNLFRESITTRIYFGDKYQFSLQATQDMLEEVREYAPHKWNEYPEVTPPEGVWMRVERCVDGRTYHFAARYVPVGDSEDYEWLSEANLSIDVDRFRPWDEEDEE